MEIKRYILSVILAASFLGAFAQENAKVTVVKNPLIDSLIARRIALNKGVTKDGTPIIVNGYRVQIFFGSDRKEAYNEQARFSSLYPEYATYISYTQPNYRVKVGDFRTRAEAQRLMTELRPTFPTLFIFQERINPLKADE
ncbi:preprotein translocase [Pelobium manganitolerans]|uniref:Preprotein translocase n=1 Tax=Pelobium manganitolerans TaxID=1842495 RepID=A0A419SC07_9SPHI|nr:SPOR domain-containing protein [Pelobium manganitolerans]RKD20200.1 preprotein translocase [Pelobium manganitolerans]